jgi:hypothetical protein
MLFADDGIGGWGAAAIGSAVTAVLTAAGVFVVRWFQGQGGYAKDAAGADKIRSAEQRAARKESAEIEDRREATTVTEYRALLARMVERVDELEREAKEERHKNRDELQALTSKLMVCEANHARVEGRLAVLEDILSANEIPFRKWAQPGSGPHLPLPPEGKAS